MPDVAKNPYEDKESIVIADQISEEKNASENDTTALRSQWSEDWKLYYSYRTDSKRNISKLISGLPFAFSENATAAIFNELLNANPYNLIDVKPANSKTPTINAFKMKILINNQIVRTKLVRKYLDYIIQGVVTGFTTAKVPLNTDIKYILRKKTFWDIFSPPDWFKDVIEVQKKIVNPNFRPNDNFTIFPAPLPTSHDIHDLPYIISEEWLPLEYFSDRPHMFFNITDDLAEDQTNELTGKKGIKTESSGTAKRVRYWERCGTFKGKDGNVREYIIGVAKKTKLVRFERNHTIFQKKPYVAGSNFNVPFQPYGRGECQPIKNNIYYMDDLICAMMDNVSSLVHTGYTVLAGSPLAKLQRLFTEPGALYKVNRHEDLQPLQKQMADVVISSLRVLQKLQSDAQFTIGASDWSMGVNPEAKEAVGAITAIQKVATSKYAKKAFLLLTQSLAETAEFFGDYNQQFITEQIEVLYQGKVDDIFKDQAKKVADSYEDMYSITINPNELQGEFLYFPNLNLMRIENAVDRQQLQNLFQFISGQQTEGINQSEFLNELLSSYPIRNLDKILKPVVFAPNDIKTVLKMLSDAGWQFIDPKGNVMGQSPTGQGGGRPGIENNPNKQPRATTETDIKKGVDQQGQGQNAGQSSVVGGG